MRQSFLGELTLAGGRGRLTSLYGLTDGAGDVEVCGSLVVGDRDGQDLGVGGVTGELSAKTGRSGDDEE